MVTTSGFTSTPTTRTLLALLLATSIGASVLSIKHYLPLKPIPHLWPYLQLWRVFTFQLAYTSSTELLFSAAIVYQLRVLERLWGSRKFASFIVAASALCMVGIVSLGLVLKILSGGWWSYIPAGMTGTVIACVAVWRREVPRLGGFKILLENDERRIRAGTARGVDFSDKWTMYVLAAQLALSQFPYGLVPAFVGWIVGSAWREELVPAGLVRWRVPGWLVGEDSSAKRRGQRQYEGLRRRLEEENQDGMREVSSNMANGGAAQEDRTAFLGGVGRYFTSGS